MFPRGALWRLVERKTREALHSGALRPIPTRCEWVADGGASFLVRVAACPQKCEHPRGRPGAASSPFLVQDEALYVADASPSHVCRLNRFPVVDRHLLIVTREYEDQETPLNRGDFQALWTCLREGDALGFYNGGDRAGASQSHKHLQVVPLPLATAAPKLPIEPFLAGATDRCRVTQSPALPFPHALARLDAGLIDAPEEAADAALNLYRELLQRAGLDPHAPRLGPYNLLATRQWLLLVPRSREQFQGISLNALAFAGAFLVKDDEQLALLRQVGPLKALAAVAGKP